MIFRFADLGIQVPFAVNAASDNHNPSQVIADVQAGGLGLPDRDYYLKPEERFKEARAKYLIHVANMFQLAGYSEADCRESCRAGDAIRDTPWPRPPSTTSLVAILRPSIIKTTYAQLQQLTPHFDWDGVLQRRQLAARQSECPGTEVHGGV